MEDALLILFGVDKHFLFYLHVVKLVGVEDFAAELAFNKFDIVFARDHAHLEVLAGGIHDGEQRQVPLFRELYPRRPPGGSTCLKIHIRQVPVAENAARVS